MGTLLEIIQATTKLTIDEKKSLADFLLVQAQQDLQGNGSSSEQIDEKIFERPDMQRSLERKWLNENWREYLGQWVAIEGDKLICHGENGHEIFAKVRAAGIKVPFVIHVQDPTLPQMGGW